MNRVKYQNSVCIIVVSVILISLAMIACSSQEVAEPYQPPVAKELPVAVRLSRPGYQKPGNHILAPSYINGYAVGYFIVDTGASLTVVNQTLADHMKLQPTGLPAKNISGIGSKFTSESYYLNPLQIGQYNYGVISASAIDIQRFTQQKRVPVSGILGMDCLRRQPVTIDYRYKQMTLHDPDTFQPPAGVKPHRFNYSHSGLILVQVKLNGQYNAWLILDTGANSSINLPVHALKQFSKLLDNKVNMQSQASGVASEFKIYRSKLDSIEILGQTLNDIDLAIEKGIQKPHPNNMIIGRVGNIVLENYVLTFDFRKRLIYAQWQPLR